ncbi:MmpS family transport accessory protein [Kribbella sp. NPDC055071]
MTQYQPPPFGAGPPAQPPKRKHPVRNAVVIVVGAIVLGFLGIQGVIWAYTGVRLAVASQEKHEIVYKVSGSGTSADIQYKNPDESDTTRSIQQLPWESETKHFKGRTQIYSITADLPSDSKDTLRCEIWVDGELLDSSETVAGTGVYCLQTN